MDLLHIIDFWFWTLVPAVMLLAVVTSVPAILIIGLIVTGRVRKHQDATGFLRQ